MSVICLKMTERMRGGTSRCKVEKAYERRRSWRLEPASALLRIIPQGAERPFGESLLATACQTQLVRKDVASFFLIRCRGTNPKRGAFSRETGSEVSGLHLVEGLNSMRGSFRESRL